MSDRPIGADAAPWNSDDFLKMSKAELYDIMYRMKLLKDDKPQEVRKILAENPQLTRFLFQAQIMLGMMGPPCETSTSQPPSLQHPQQAQTSQQPSAKAALPLPGEASLLQQTSGSQTQVPVMKKMASQPAMQAAASVPATNPQSQSMPLHVPQTAQQPTGHLNIQIASSQIPNTPPLPTSSASQSSIVQPQMPAAPNQFQQVQTPVVPHMTLQPPLPPHPRLPLPPTFQHQHPSQMASNMAFQHSGSQLHHSQPVFHAGSKPIASIGTSFTQAQPQIPNQPPSQSFSQIGGSPHLRTEFINPAGSSMQVDRGSSSWMPPRHEKLPGPTPVVPGQMGLTNLSPRPPLLNPEMEKALLQQVMSLTPEQINRLPPEQRHQILQLQQMLRQ